MPLLTLKGEISGRVFTSPDFSFSFLKSKNFFYDTGHVFALFELIGEHTYILRGTVPIKLETAGIEG